MGRGGDPFVTERETTKSDALALRPAEKNFGLVLYLAGNGIWARTLVKFAFCSIRTGVLTAIALATRRQMGGEKPKRQQFF